MYRQESEEICPAGSLSIRWVIGDPQQMPEVGSSAWWRNSISCCLSWPVLYWYLHLWTACASFLMAKLSSARVSALITPECLKVWCYLSFLDIGQKIGGGPSQKVCIFLESKGSQTMHVHHHMINPVEHFSASTHLAYFSSKTSSLLKRKHFHPGCQVMSKSSLNSWK